MKDSIEKMRTKFPDCCDVEKKVAQENGKKFKIECSKTYYLKVHIDDCLISCKQVSKCDYLFIRDYECLQGETEFYFVELKAEGKRENLSPLQKNFIRKLKSLNCDVRVISSFKEVDNFIKEVIYDEVSST